MEGPLEDRVLAILARVAGPHRTPPSPGPDTPLAEGGFWLDSADLFEVVLACETEFDVRFDGDKDLTPGRLMTVATLSETIHARLGQTPDPDRQ
jgi:acyl carrier protein